MFRNVQDFPPKTEKWWISAAGGGPHFWRTDGRKLSYKEGSKVRSVEIKTDAGRFDAGIPKLSLKCPGAP